MQYHMIVTVITVPKKINRRNSSGFKFTVRFIVYLLLFQLLRFEIWTDSISCGLLGDPMTTNLNMYIYGNTSQNLHYMAYWHTKGMAETQASFSRHPPRSNMLDSTPVPNGDSATLQSTDNNSAPMYCRVLVKLDMCAE